MVNKASELAPDARDAALNIICLRELQSRSRRNGPRWHYLANWIYSEFTKMDQIGAPSLETIDWSK